MNNKTFYLDSTFETKGLSETKSLKIAGYANTVTKDRTDEIVTAEAWAKGLENFRKNPVMLYQHKKDQPIGRFDKLVVDKKGLYVEGTISEVAERNYGIHTLIKDGALKSFSVGFRALDGKYDKVADTLTITDVELLEISVVSVPANQESLFSIRKSFDTDADYASFKESFVETSYKSGISEVANGHYHTIELDINNNGVTTYCSHDKSHVHQVIDGVVQETEGHTHDIKTIVEFSEKTEVAPPDSTEVEKELVIEDNTKSDVESKEEEEAIPSYEEPIPFINMLTSKSISLGVGTIITHNEKLFKVTEVPSDQNQTFKLFEIDAEGNYCDNTATITIKDMKVSEELHKTITEELHEDSTKEINIMAEQVVDTINLADIRREEVKTVATVSEPRVAELVEKTGEAILREADAKDKYGEFTPTNTDEVKELRSQVSKYKDEIAALQNSKMLYAENSRTSQFSEKEMANAMFLAKALNKADPFSTKYGSRMKAITTVDSFITNFSNNIYTEMQQQLVIAPLFQRIPVDAKTFRVPVADEDTDGDVAMFRSGTYATGIADLVNVPTSNQNQISAVEFSPHKFMATTHLAKDEEEDTVLPLIEFLRDAATRRLARAIDKSILRGTGALSGFTASPTNAISAGAGYASVIKGVTKLASDASLATATTNSSTKADPSNIAAARAAMGKYGLQLGNDLVFVTSIEGYNNLVTTSDFRTVDKFGPNATYLTGSVGAVYGIPIIISEFLDNVGVTGNTLGTLLYKPGFLLAERRGVEVESEYEPRQQVTAMYLSTRFDFKALTTNNNAALDNSRYSYAVNVNAG